MLTSIVISNTEKPEKNIAAWAFTFVFISIKMMKTFWHEFIKKDSKSRA